MMDLTEKTIESEILYKGKILTLKRDTVLLPNGEKGVRETISHGGGAAVLVVKEGCFYMVKQFRYPYKKQILEIPAGKLNPGENPETTAIRELEEEGGVRAKTVELIQKVYPSTGPWRGASRRRARSRRRPTDAARRQAPRAPGP